MKKNYTSVVVFASMLLCTPGIPFLRTTNASRDDDGKIVLVRSVERVQPLVNANYNLPGLFNYYVNVSTGSDSRGSAEAQNPLTPWRTPNRAFGRMKIGPNGTILHLAAGTYTANVACENSNAVDICVTQGGISSTARLTIQCDAPWSRPSSSGCLLRGSPVGYISLFTADHVRIVGFDAGTSATAGYGINVYCDRSKAGFACAHGNDVIIETNYIHDFGSVTTYNTNGGPAGCPQNGAMGGGQHGYYYTKPPIAVGNFVANVYQKPCNFAHGIYFSSPGTQLYNNVVVSAAAAGFQIYSSACGSIVANNVSLNNGSSGFIVSNTDDGCALYGVAGFNTVINNISDNNGGKGFHQTSPGNDCTSATPSLYANNMTYGNAAGSQDLGPCDNWTQAPPLSRENPTSTFLKYQADGSGDYRLSTGSVAIGRGTSRCAPLAAYSTCTSRQDFQGSGWNDAARDIGAYANGSSPGSYPPQF
jgi:hypothetical protein